MTFRLMKALRAFRDRERSACEADCGEFLSYTIRDEGTMVVAGFDLFGLDIHIHVPSTMMQYAGKTLRQPVEECE